MSAYILVQLSFKDVDAYQRYRAKFPAVFSQFDGRIVVADTQPVSLQGNLGRDKVVLLEFRDEQEAKRFFYSPAYREISADFALGAEATFTLLKGMQPA